MKMPQHIFALTRSEQRAVILIMIALLAGAAARQYHDWSLRPALPSSSIAAPAASPLDEESAIEEGR